MRDQPKNSYRLWGPVYDSRIDAYRPGTLWDRVSGGHEYVFLGDAECGGVWSLEHSRDLAEHLLGVYLHDGFHCPGCLRSLRRVKCRGGWVW